MEQLLGIDLGTSAVKAVVVAAHDGRVRGQGVASYPTNHPQPGWAEQDPPAWWEATVTAVQQAVAAAGDESEVAAVGVSGQMHGTVLLDDDERTLMPAVIWADQRSRRQVEEITESIGAERLIELAGSPVATGFQAATLRWVQQERPELWRRVHSVLLPKDYLRRRMTGGHATDPSDAAGTLLLDVRARDWSSELLHALDIDRDLLPPVVASTSVAGALTRTAADALGLAAGTPVVLGAGDTPSSALGAGIVAADTLLLTIGTGGQLVLPTPDVRVDPAGRIHTFCSALPTTPEQAGWYHMGATLCAGMAVRWLRDRVLEPDDELGYDDMMSWATEVPIGAEGLLFLPYLVGERTPHMEPRARGLFLGLTLQHGRAELVRAVVEGVTLALYDAYGALCDVTDAPERIVLAGGGAQSRLWQQIVADVFGLPVRRLQITEQSALGAAVLAGAGIGLFDAGTKAREWAHYGTPIAPEREHHERYRTLFTYFREAYRSNRELLHTLHDWNA